MEVDSFCNVNSDGLLSLEGGPRQQNISLKTRYSQLKKMFITPIDDNERQRLGLPQTPDWLQFYHHEGAGPLRQLSLLHPFRAEGYPDDIKFILPPDENHHPEAIWGRIEELFGEKFYVCKLLNEPDQDFGYHEGERVLVAVWDDPEGVKLLCLGPVSRFTD